MRLRSKVGLLAAALALAAAVQASTNGAAIAGAASRGDAQAVRSLLRQGADVNAAQGDGMTALHWAAMQGDAELATTLLRAGASLKASTRLAGYAPLPLAARNGHAAVIAALLKAGADANSKTGSGTTPLMLAASAGQPEAVKLLLDQRADVNAREPFKGHTALMFAAALDRVDAVKLLLATGADAALATTTFDLTTVRDVGGERRAPRVEGAAARPAGEPSPPPRKPLVAGVERNYANNELVGAQGGLTPLLFAARQGARASAEALVDAGAPIDQLSAGDRTSPLLIATINGHFDLAGYLLDKGADSRLASENGVTPLYAALNCQWAPKAFYPQPRAHLQQKTTYLDLMKALLQKGADVNARLKKKVWYSGYNQDLSGVDEGGATPFWRAAYASDVDAMRLLMAAGADPMIPTRKPPGRPRNGDGDVRESKDVSGLLPVPVGGPGVPALLAAAGVGYGEGYAANSHRNHPAGWMPAVRYLVEELGADVNAKDHEGDTALHHAAARGDNEMILYLVSKGADVKAVNREGQTTADMANGPVQRVQPFPETVKLLEKLGSKNNHKCVSC